MAKRDDLSGWYEDQERTYYADSNGRPIVVKQNPFNYHSPATGIPIYPQVVRGDFKPSTDTASSSSYPPRSRRPSPSSRFSDHNTPYFGPGSVHSGRGHVDHPASTPSVSGYSRPNISTDVYRDAKGEFYRAGPSKSPYDQRYHQYKANQDEALQLSKEYATWKEPNRLGVPPHERDAHPEMYGGRPLATKEWHDEGGRRAREVAKASHAHADARASYHEDFIGYHQPSYNRGHTDAIATWRNRAGNYEEKAKRHEDWVSLQDERERGRSKKRERQARRG